MDLFLRGATLLGTAEVGPFAMVLCYSRFREGYDTHILADFFELGFGPMYGTRRTWWERSPVSVWPTTFNRKLLCCCVRYTTQLLDFPRQCYQQEKQ